MLPKAPVTTLLTAATTLKAISSEDTSIANTNLQQLVIVEQLQEIVN